MKRLLLCALLVGCGGNEKPASEPPLDSAVALDAIVVDAASETTVDTSVADSGGLVIDSGSCVPTESIEKTCNGKDDDCNGVVDDVDVAKDGICDCLGVLIYGSTGALAASTFEAWLKEKGTTSKRRLDTAAAGPITATDLMGIDVLILDRLSRDPSADEIKLIDDWVSNGGALVAMTGYDHSGADASRPNLIIKPLGAEYDVAIKPPGPVTDWDATHPIAKDMTSVTFAGGYAVSPIAGAKTTIVARSAGNPVAIALDFGKGRAFVWGDEWIEYDSEWKSVPTVPKLWANIFGWVVQRRCGVKIF